MLNLEREEGEWVDVTHKSGDVMRVRVCQITPAEPARGSRPGRPARLNLVFDDAARNFAIERPERKAPSRLATR